MSERAPRHDAQWLARLLTRIEAEDPAALGAAVRAEADFGGSSHVVGLTGPPGVGKSTLTGALIKAARKRGQTVAVLAVDPSSARTGGAVLGDRLRMLGSVPDPGVFIRSMATRGRIGGLSTSAPAAVAALAGAGYDLVIVEAVGAGQNEIDLADVVDTTVVVAAPGMGDAVQALKAGLLEIGDHFVVNKADHGGAGQTESQLRAMLAAGTRAPSSWRPLVTRAVAVRGEGINELLDAFHQHDTWLRKTDERLGRRQDRLLQVVRGAALRTLHERLETPDVDVETHRLAKDVASGDLQVRDAAEVLLSLISSPRDRERPVTAP